jgi:hypothetical protein
LVSALAVLALGAVAHAATRYVAANGVDSGACGTLAAPCRSITQGIANAAVGDSISVGPGSYGDLDFNGTLGGPGEEPNVPACGWISTYSCMVRVNKSVKIYSSAGAGSTVIVAPTSLSLYAVVSLDSPGAELGKLNKGFTLSGASRAVRGEAAGVKLVGNRLDMAGAEIDSDNAVVRANVGTAFGLGGFGFVVFGDGIQVVGNVAVGGYQTGFAVGGTDWTMTGNVANGNLIGILLTVSDPTWLAPTKFDKNSAVGNIQQGVVVQAVDNPPGGATLAITRGNAYGNGTLSPIPFPNCGLFVFNSDGTDGVTVNADGYYWGAAAPGADPADEAAGGPCSSGTGIAVNVTNSATAAVSIKPPPQR